MHWDFKKEKPYFVLDPDGEGLSYFATEKERDEYSEECIDNYLDDGWDENVIHVLGGKITHLATEINRIDRPDAINGVGFDCDGNYWKDADVAYKCNYKLLPINEETND